MTSPVVMLSPCGTSLLTHKVENDVRSLIFKHANSRAPEDLDAEDRKTLQARMDAVRAQLLKSDIAGAARMSAELNGITRYFENQMLSGPVHHVLLCTDTWLGESTATMVRDWLQADPERKKLHSVEIKRQGGLRTDHVASFQTALSDLVRWFEESFNQYREQGYHAVFNLTGGFKSVQGFLQTLASFYADETVYVFETARDLMRIPRLPVEMRAEGMVRDALTPFRRLALGLPVTEVSGISELFLMRIDDLISLSEWGELVWGRTHRTIYEERLWPSPSQKVVFGPGFERSLRGLSPDRMHHINERLDALAAHLELTEKPNPASLDFKPLRSNPRPPSTHEMDAWADGDARRIFGHFEEGTFVLDKLDAKLR